MPENNEENLENVEAVETVEATEVAETEAVETEKVENTKTENKKPARGGNREPRRERKPRRDDEKDDEIKEKVVAINRVAKVVKGGRNFRFSAVVVVGDGKGHVGVGNGKAAEVPDAIKKAIEEAKKNMIEVPMVGTTIPHEYIGIFGSAKVVLRPAPEGTGVIAGGSVRPVLELAGYKDINTKILGTHNPRNVVNATIKGLKEMQTLEQVAKKRGKKIEEIA